MVPLQVFVIVVCGFALGSLLLTHKDWERMHRVLPRSWLLTHVTRGSRVSQLRIRYTCVFIVVVGLVTLTIASWLESFEEPIAAEKALALGGLCAVAGSLTKSAAIRRLEAK